MDLYLLHWPVSVKPGEYELPVKKKDLLPIDIKSVWEAMEECQKLGLSKSIGVSNFSCKKLETLLATAKIPPAVNQVSNFFLAKCKLLCFNKIHFKPLFLPSAFVICSSKFSNFFSKI